MATIKSLKDAEKAILKAQKLKDEIKPKMDESTDLMRSACRFLVSKDKDKLEFKDGRLAKVITPAKRFWVGMKQDMPANAPDDAKPLKSLVDKETFQALTRRMPDPEKIQNAIALGEVDEDEIAPAFIEIPQGSYIRMFVGDDD